MTYPTITLPELLEQTAAKSPDATALIYFGTTISYRQLQDQVNRLAAGLQALGVEKGDRVALMMPNCPQFVISYFGALRAGAIVTATSSMYTAREAAHQWNDAGVKVVIADRRLFPVIRPALPQLASAPQIVLTGLRQYYPQPFRRLCASLEASTDQERPRCRGQPPAARRSTAGRRSSAFPVTPCPEWPDACRILPACIHRRHDRDVQGRHAHPR